jgi:molybdopterin synthase catalytic subunit
VRWLVEVTIGAMLDERSRRAIEETLLDWAHEADQTQGRLAAIICHARGVLGLVRVIASVVLYQVPQLLTSV